MHLSCHFLRVNPWRYSRNLGGSSLGEIHGFDRILVVNPYFVHCYDTAKKLGQIAVEQSKILLRLANVSPILRIAFPYPNDNSISKLLSHVICLLFGYHDLAYCQCPFSQHHIVNFFIITGLVISVGCQERPGLLMIVRQQRNS